MAIIILVGVVGALLVLSWLGLVKQFTFSWDLVFRIFVYILLFLGVLGFVAKVWSIIVVLAHLPAKWLVSPSGNPTIDVISTAALGIALFGIWRWKKWGAYLVLIRLAFTVAVQLFVYQSLSWQLFQHYTGFQNVIADLIGAAMWIVAFSLTWKHFK